MRLGRNWRWLKYPRNVGIAASGLVVIAGIAVLLYYVFASATAQPPDSDPTITAIDYTADLQEYCVVLANSNNPHVGRARLKALEHLSRAESVADVGWRVDYALRMSHERLKFGDAEEAIRLLENALVLEEARGVDEERVEEIIDSLIVAHIRQGENDNCVSPSGRFTCSLPLSGRVHSNPEGSAAAIGYLNKMLSIHPSDIRYRWLLNLSHMTVGTYPDAVPDKFLISPSVFTSKKDIGRFEEIAPEAGIYNVKLAGGGIVEDFDNDGLLDIITTTWDPCGSMAYYHNDGDGRFSEVVASGLERQLGGLNAVQADYNNDGWVDVLVLRGGWMLEDGQMRMSLLRNNGDNTFSDVTHVAGLASELPRQSASWADYDLDGHLDLFVCNESQPYTWYGEPKKDRHRTIYASELFHNNRDGTFTDVAFDARVTNDRYCKGSAWGDFDNDGDPDLYVSNFEDLNRLYRNDGDGTFIDIAYPAGVMEPIDSFATWFWDYDNNGCLDLFVAGYGSDIAEVAEDYLGLSTTGTRPKLYRNNCTGTFEDVTEQAGLYQVHLTMGANYGDLNNDGFQDLVLGTGFVDYDSLEPNVAYLNDGFGHFVDISFASGMAHLQKGHAIAFGDLDRDGDQDIFMQIGGFFPGDAFLSALYENPGHYNHWLSVKLVGTDSNKDGLGARIKIRVDEHGLQRDVFSYVSTGGSFGASSIEQEIGLGRIDRIVSLEILWPSGKLQILEQVEPNRHIRITEGESGFEVLPRSSFILAPDRALLDFN